MLFILFIILLENSLFYVFSWAHVPNTLKTADIALFLIWIVTLYLLIKRDDEQLKILKNNFSLIILFLLWLIPIHMILANHYYSIPYVQAFIAGRRFLHYVSYFLFLLILDTNKKIIRLLDLINYLALTAIILGIVNYFGFEFLHHKKAGGDVIRAGISRAYIPGMSLVSFAALWSFTKLICSDKMLTTKTTTLITYVAHFFRQTRSRIITLTIVSIVLLFWKKQYKFAISVLLFLFLIAFLFQTYAKSNFFLHPYLSAKNDITKVEGTWRGRIRQIKIDLEEFRKHPLIGSGSSVLRSNTEIYKGKDIHEIEHLMNLAYSDDLGYTHWIKHFGLIGVLIIILYFWSLFRKGLYVLKKCDEESKKVVTFSVLYLLFTCISFVTLNHFEIHHLIILNCLNAAIIVRSEYFLE